MMTQLYIKKIGRAEYIPTWDQMKAFTEARDANTPDEIWVVEHPPVFTQGRSGKPEHILNPKEIPVVQIDRGGQVTYHGPGQLVAYPLIDLRRRKMGIRQFITAMEQAVIQLLADLNIQAQSKVDAPGIYVNGSKICSIGIRVVHGCTYHGLALNVKMDLEPFSRINPCGFQNLTMTQISVLNPHFTWEMIEETLCRYLSQQLGYSSFEYKKAENKMLRKPDWIRVKLPATNKIAKVQDLLREGKHSTVCEEANCPNRAECYGCGTATFLIMGDICTRHCQFCNVVHGKPLPLDADEPRRLANTIASMKLKYVVLTSVDRDDIKDGGAKHYVECMKAIRQKNSEIKIEILTPDFRGCQEEALDILAESPADVFNHNIETVRRLHKQICPSCHYELSLELLKKHKKRFPHILTKSGIMVGFGENNAEVEETLKELREYQVDMVTIGQYLPPSRNHWALDRYVTPAEFDAFRELAKKMGFIHVASGPLVRSSYHAEQQCQ